MRSIWPIRFSRELGDEPLATGQHFSLGGRRHWCSDTVLATGRGLSAGY
jgi:hypothetical protein